MKDGNNWMNGIRSIPGIIVGNHEEVKPKEKPLKEQNDKPKKSKRRNKNG